jgi:hypothetical protein
MQQPSRFPSPAMPAQPLPKDVQTHARELLTELVSNVVRAASEARTNSEGTSHEQDSKNHLERATYVYVRQSTPSQVRNNVQSQLCQYSLDEHARQLGFSNIQVIDDDLGTSGSGHVRRSGFETLLAASAVAFSPDGNRLAASTLTLVVEMFSTLAGQKQIAVTYVWDATPSTAKRQTRDNFRTSVPMHFLAQVDQLKQDPG